MDGKIIMMTKEQTKQFALNEIKSSEEKRLITADPELNRVLGGGIVPGSIVLDCRRTGIGKSTLFLQNGLTLTNIIVLYISGEESEQQIKMRADRLKSSTMKIFTCLPKHLHKPFSRK